MASALILTLFPLAMIFASLFDLFTMKIPNAIVLVLLAGFCVAAPLAGMPWDMVLKSFAVAFGVLVVGFVLFSIGVMGGGDAKILFASSLWLGPWPTAEYLVYVGLMGGALTILLLSFRSIPLPIAAKGIHWIDRLHDPKIGVPYGVALGPAALIVFPGSALGQFALSGIALS